MKHRLSRIVTRTGDQGDTGLSDGSRIRKSHNRIKAMGSIDELNSHLGLLTSLLGASPNLQAELLSIQHHLFELGGELALPGSERIEENDLLWLEQLLHQHNQKLPPLTEFVLPGGSMANAQAHVARTCCRRAERDWIELADLDPLNPCSQRYLNRLSDYLFVISRRIQQELGLTEVCWDRRHIASALNQ